MYRLITFTSLLAVFFTFSFDVKSQSKTTEETKVMIKTAHGDMTVKLYNETPLHRDNFITLVEEGYFNNLTFYQVIADFMIQGGDPSLNNDAIGENSVPHNTIDAEILTQFYHKKGALGAARQSDQFNPQRKSTSGQFYIVQGKLQNAQIVMNIEERKNISNRGLNYAYTDEAISDYGKIGGAPHLDGEYTIFGQVIEGLTVIDKIARMPVDNSGRPIEDILMSIEILK